MSTTDSTTRRSATWLSILVSFTISAGCGGAPGESDEQFAFDGACEREEECGDAFAGGGDETFDDEGSVDEEDEALADPPLTNDDAPNDPNPVDPPPYDPGRDSAGTPNSDGGRTPAPQPDADGGRSAPPPNTSGGTEPVTRGGVGTYDPGLPNRQQEDLDPEALKPECIPGESRCVAGDASVVEQCNARGFWTTTSCGRAELCTDNACTVACELSVEPTDSYVCYVPNQDGVNDGILWVSNDPEHMENGTLTGIRVHYTSNASPAPIRRVPDGLYHGGSWPYEWKIASAGQLRQAMIEFRLDQFSHLPGPLRSVDFTYWARRVAPIQISDPQVTVNYETRAVAFAWEPTKGPFGNEPAHVLDYAYFRGDIQTHSIPAVFGANAFDHQGGRNVMGIDITGDGTGTPPMDAYVNFVMLTVR